MRTALLAVLILVSIVDGLLAYLVALFSEMIFGQHEGMHGETAAVAEWLISLIACIAAPIAGFVLWAHRRPGTGIAIAVLPVVGALLLLAS